MTYKLPHADPHMALLDAIENSKNGDVIVVHNKWMHELASISKAEMCPDKDISFVITCDEMPDIFKEKS